ncbi:phage exclusion protein Lit family protein [Paraburkholderia sp. BL21I4N1]|uniref:phage exclusion protein Lit family protein n=1 Tax=Paraburkholderia sp. BL21I4N1 TaxID=1938801 RepID=UPI000CFCFA91|nr:phage exclusion protein Lit family protein [Paraburkholderia sp. BL21I4N1]PQV52194.1 peptidase U49-like protein [Paraburkholderia sp. BL21I4N1]
MRSPILALQGNMLHAFENPNGSAVKLLEDAAAEGIVSPEIDLIIDELPPMTPSVSRQVGEAARIHLHITQLELMWAFVYGWVVLYEEAVQRPWMENRYNGRILLETTLTQRAAALLDWATGLRTTYRAWPDRFPSPRYALDDQEYEYALKVNGIFQSAVAFLLFHEFGHVTQRHLDAIIRNDTDAGALATAIAMEREADDYAFRILLSGNDDEATRRTKGWAVLSPALSSMYLVDGRARVYQARHPHLHHRVQGILSKLNFHEDRNRFYYHYLRATILRTFDRAYALKRGTQLSPELFETADEAFDAEMDDLDVFLRSGMKAPR